MDSVITKKLDVLKQSIIDGDMDVQRALYKELQKAGYEDEAANVHRVVCNDLFYTDF
jgi:hypothetical protein